MSNLTIAPSVPLVVACHDLATSVPLASFTLPESLYPPVGTGRRAVIITPPALKIDWAFTSSFDCTDAGAGFTAACASLMVKGSAKSSRWR